MKQIKLLGLALMAMLALTGITSATTASAEELPNILPAGTLANNILATSLSGTSEFGRPGLLKVKSTKSEGFLDGLTTRLGDFDALFLNTTTLEQPCTGLDDTVEGSVLAKGTFHIVDFDETDPNTGKLTLLTGVSFLLRPVHFECPGAGVLVVVRGCVVGALTPENVLTKVLTVTLARNGLSNDNLIITILNDNNVGEACQLLSSENGGAFALSTEVTTQVLTGFHKDPSLTALEVLVMRR